MVMPPPAISAYLRNYIEQLKLEAKTLSEKKLVEPMKPSNPIETYTHQIISWISALPDSQQRQPYGIDSIIRLANLRGIHTESASPQQVALALRKAGFNQFRSYKKTDRNARLWMWTSNPTKPS
jgi:hypothetical protein